MVKEAVVIEPARPLRLLDAAELWRFRELLWVLARRDIKVRYRQTWLGASWAVLQPVAQALIFTLIFGRLLGAPADRQPYPLFVFAGLWLWGFFAGTVERASGSLINASSLLTKAYFPRLILPLAALATHLVDLGCAAVALSGLCWWYGVAPTTQIAWLPLVIGAAGLLAFAVGTLSAALIVVHRDLQHLLRLAMQLWLYATPVVYASSLLPERWRALSFLNPMTGLVEACRGALFGTQVDASGLLLSGACGAALLVAALLVFHAVEARFADIL